MTQNLDHIIQRTRRYWYDDGIAELVAGGLFCLGAVTLFTLTQIRLPENLIAQLLIAVLIFGVTMFISLRMGTLVKRVTDSLKDRITYPRTGYVEYHMPKIQPRSPTRKIVSWLIFMFVTMAIAAVIAFLLARAPLPAWAFSMPAVVGLYLTVMLMFLAYRLRLLRFYILAGLSLALTALIISSDLGKQDALGTAAFMIVIGILFIGSGAITMTRYLRQTQQFAEGNRGQ